MGAKLLSYYEFAKAKGGIQLQVKLSMKTCLTQAKVANEPDSPELVKKFYEALRELTGNDPGVPKP